MKNLVTPVVELDDVLVYKNPPAAYINWVAAGNAYFDGNAWGGVLEQGFSANRHYIWDQRYEIGTALTTFQKGPVRLGYLGFPVCCMAVNSPIQKYSLIRMVGAARLIPSRIDLLRIAISAFGNCTFDSIDSYSRHTIETCIEDLHLWGIETDATRRRAIKRAQQRCAALEFDTNATASELHILYGEAVRRNRGSIRYTKTYFDALSKSLRSPHLHLVALRKGSKLVCMVITARHGNTTYYLHGGGQPEALRAGASDLAMGKAIEHAQCSGALRFNFLSSPTNQPGLIRFKEKWGGASRQASTKTLPTNALGRVLAVWLA